MMDKTALESRSRCAAPASPNQATGATLPSGSFPRKFEGQISFPRHHHSSLQTSRSDKASRALITSGYIGSLPEIQPTINTHRPRAGQRLSPTHF
jgi:hypothetical protein